jgi:PKD repeat protein
VFLPPVNKSAVLPENGAPNTSPPSTDSQASNGADLRPENIQDAVIHLAQSRCYSRHTKIYERIFVRARWSRRIIIIASFPFLLILSPAYSQPPPVHHHLQAEGPLQVRLQPEKETVQIGEPVRFTAKLSHPLSGVFYEFRDADGRHIGGGKNQPEAEGRFLTPGPHVVTVRVLVNGPPLTASTKINVIPLGAGHPVPGPVRVQLSADKSQVRVGEVVTFTISTIPDLPNFDYLFDAGDGSPISLGKTRKIQHTYSKPRNYTAQVSLRGAELPGRARLVISVDRPFPTAVPTATPSTRPTPTAAPPLKVYLSVDKSPSSVGESVTFFISTNRNKQHLYELNFGDRSELFQTRRNSVRHIFEDPGNYIVSVKVLDDRSHPRAEVGIFVDRWTPRWWVYILAGLAVVYILAGLAVVVLRRLLRPKPTPPPIPAQPPPIPVLPPPIPALPTFHPHWDPGAPQKQQENLTVNYELHFEPNVSKGRQRLETRAASLIVSKKKKQ